MPGSRVRAAVGVPLVALALGSAALLGERRAAAQDAPSAEPAPAPAPDVSAGTEPASGAIGAERAAFQRGLEALADQRYADALAAFQRSYQLRRVASVALNLGITLRALGRLIEARRYFREFMELANEAQLARHLTAVRGYLQEISQQVGAVHVAERAPASASLTLDGHAAVPDAEGLIEADPGEHRVEAEAPGYAPFRQTVTVERGARAEVRVVLARPTAQPDARVALTPGEQGRARGGESSVTSQWWFWGGISLAVVAAVAIPVAVVAGSGVDAPAGLGTDVVLQAQRRP